MGNTNRTILEMKGITKFIFDAYGNALRNATVRILDKVDFDLREGEVHILVGENGAGKSTLMKILGGILPADEGTILLDGKEVHPHNAKEAMELGIGFIHQELNLCNNLTVAQNIFMGREKKGRFLMDNRGMLREAHKMLQELGIDIDPSVQVAKLSTAQQQVVEIVKVLSYNCRIIIMDEPTSSLTRKEIDFLFKLIDHLRSEGVSVIYISHRTEEFEQVGDRLSVLRDGQYIGTLERDEFELSRIVSMMVGRTLGAMYEQTHVPSEEVALEVSDLRLEEHTAPIHIKVHAGEVVGFAGLVGAGRTELAKSIYGVRHSYGGSIRYFGEPVHHPDPEKWLHQGLIYLTEDRKTEGLILDMGIPENITLANLWRMFPKGVLNRSKEAAAAQEMVKELNIISKNWSQPVKTLSGGNQQKVVLGKCLETQPRVLVLDEPTRGIDVGAKQEIYHIIDHIAAQGVAILMISSEMPELIGMSDRIYVMKDGSIVKEVSNKEDMRQESLLEAMV